MQNTGFCLITRNNHLKQRTITSLLLHTCSICCLTISSVSAMACSVMARSLSSSYPSCSAPRSMTSLEQPAAKPLLLYFFFRDFSSISFVLFEGRIRTAAQISPVNSSTAKSTFSIPEILSSAQVCLFTTGYNLSPQ